MPTALGSLDRSTPGETTKAEAQALLQLLSGGCVSEPAAEQVRLGPHQELLATLLLLWGGENRAGRHTEQGRESQGAQSGRYTRTLNCRTLVPAALQLLQLATLVQGELELGETAHLDTAEQRGVRGSRTSHC